MYRTQNQAESKSPTDDNLDNEDNYEFTGATLKIADKNVARNDPLTVKTDSSAILNGTDALSPSISDQSSSSSYRTEGKMDTATYPQVVSSPSPETAPITKPKVGSPANFFSFRNGLFDQAVADITNMLLTSKDDANVVGSWLLTEINHWDHEREKVFILTTKSLWEIKYDFIALRVLDHMRIQLSNVDKIVKGQLKYPDNSLVPRIEGISNGVASLVNGALFSSSNLSDNSTRNPKPGLAITKRFDFSQFKPIERSEMGIRIMWNKGQVPTFLQSWNPFSNEIPWKTITDHPLFSYQDPYNSPAFIKENLEKNHKIYSVDLLYQSLVRMITEHGATNSLVNPNCKFEDGPILLQNYVGIGAMIHNKHNFGFFKVRGKFSF